MSNKYVPHFLQILNLTFLGPETRPVRCHCGFLEGPCVSCSSMWSCLRDPGTWNCGGISFVWNLAQTYSDTLGGVVYGLLPFNPNQQAHGCISQAIKNMSTLLFLCVIWGASWSHWLNHAGFQKEAKSKSYFPNWLIRNISWHRFECIRKQQIHPSTVQRRLIDLWIWHFQGPTSLFK